MHEILSTGHYQKRDYMFVAIVGQVDHGKTLLFEKLSRRLLRRYEAKQITQTIYFHNFGNMMIFDTPGHENFHHMRKVVLPLCDLVLVVVNATNPESAKKFTRELDKLSKPYIILLSFSDKLSEEQLIGKLTSCDLLPSNFGGNYEVKAVRYDEFNYQPFSMINCLNVSEVLDYLLDFGSMFERQQIVGKFGYFYLLNKIFSTKVGELHVGIMIGGQHISAHDIVSSMNNSCQNIQILKLFRLESPTFPVKSIANYAEVFYAKLSGNLTVGNYYVTSSPDSKLRIHDNELKKSSNLVDFTGQKLLVAVVTSDENQCKSVLDPFQENEYVVFLTFTGNLTELDAYFVKDKKGLIVFYNFQPSLQNINFYKQNNITYLVSNDFFEVKDFITESLVNFGNYQKISELEGRAKSRAKILKKFNFQGQVVVGARLLNNTASVSDKAYILGKDRIKTPLLFIKKIEIISRKVSMLRKDDEFGISFTPALTADIDIGDQIIFLEDE